MAEDLQALMERIQKDAVEKAELAAAADLHSAFRPAEEAR